MPLYNDVKNIKKFNYENHLHNTWKSYCHVWQLANHVFKTKCESKRRALSAAILLHDCVCGAGVRARPPTAIKRLWVPVSKYSAQLQSMYRSSMHGSISLLVMFFVSFCVVSLSVCSRLMQPWDAALLTNLLLISFLKSLPTALPRTKIDSKCIRVHASFLAHARIPYLIFLYVYKHITGRIGPLSD